MTALTLTSRTEIIHKRAFTFKLHNYCGEYKMDGYYSYSQKNISTVKLMF